MEIFGYVLIFASILVPTVALKARYTRTSLVAGLVATTVFIYIGCEMVSYAHSIGSGYPVAPFFFSKISIDLHRDCPDIIFDLL